MTFLSAPFETFDLQHMQKLPLAVTLVTLSIVLSILVFAHSVCASDISKSSPSTHLNDRFLIFDVEGYAILVDASTGAPLSSWTEVSPPFGASPPSSSASSLTDVSIMYEAAFGILTVCDI